MNQVYTRTWSRNIGSQSTLGVSVDVNWSKPALFHLLYGHCTQLSQNKGNIAYQVSKYNRKAEGEASNDKPTLRIKVMHIYLRFPGEWSWVLILPSYILK